MQNRCSKLGSCFIQPQLIFATNIACAIKGLSTQKKIVEKLV